MEVNDLDVAGWITLGTKISDEGLKKDLIKIKKELEKSAAQEDRLLSRKEKLELQIEIDQSKIDTTERKIADIKKYKFPDLNFNLKQGNIGISTLGNQPSIFGNLISTTN